MKIDHAIIYQCPDDPGNYICHSYRTDNIGVGNSAKEAEDELVRALNSLVDEGKKHPEINIFRDAGRSDPVFAYLSENIDFAANSDHIRNQESGTRGYVLHIHDRTNVDVSRFSDAA